jgi:leucyl aminopeptidase
MIIHVQRGKITEYHIEALLVSHFEDSASPEGPAGLLDQSCGGQIRDILASGDFQGKLYQISVLYMRGSIPAKRIVIVGLGKRADFDLEKLRGAYAKAGQQIRALNLKEFALSIDTEILNKSLPQLTETILEGMILGLYRFMPYKTIDREKIMDIQDIHIVEENGGRLKLIRESAKTAETVAKAVMFTRDLVSRPGNEMTPSDLALGAREVARRRGVTLKILDTTQMKKLGMNALLGVARGSSEPAKFIILEYYGRRKSDPPIALVGKGLTFDSGGISIKPSEKMDEMKADMAGGAAVMGTIMAAADLRLPANVVGMIPATENLSGGGAYKPGDILKSLSGQTIEVITTDAEGRLILADALTYALRYKPAAIIDLATLTGACIIALGDHVIGMLGTDDSLKDKIRKAADMTGEMVWELPLWEDYHELIKSDVADFKNSGGRPGGAITAAVFLSKFVENVPWVHLDIAGPAWLAKDKPYIPKGASGVGVRLMVQVLRDLAAGKTQETGR